MITDTIEESFVNPVISSEIVCLALHLMECLIGSKILLTGIDSPCTVVRTHAQAPISSKSAVALQMLGVSLVPSHELLNEESSLIFECSNKTRFPELFRSEFPNSSLCGMNWSTLCTSSKS